MPQTTPDTYFWLFTQFNRYDKNICFRIVSIFSHRKWIEMFNFPRARTVGKGVFSRWYSHACTRLTVHFLWLNLKCCVCVNATIRYYPADEDNLLAKRIRQKGKKKTIKGQISTLRIISRKDNLINQVCLANWAFVIVAIERTENASRTRLNHTDSLIRSDELERDEDGEKHVVFLGRGGEGGAMFGVHCRVWLYRSAER